MKLIPWMIFFLLIGNPDSNQTFDQNDHHIIIELILFSDSTFHKKVKSQPGMESASKGQFFYKSDTLVLTTSSLKVWCEPVWEDTVIVAYYLNKGDTILLDLHISDNDKRLRENFGDAIYDDLISNDPPFKLVN